MLVDTIRFCRAENHDSENFSYDQLNAKANQIRKDIIKIAVKNGAGHIAPSLSCVDILTSLYYKILTISDSPTWEERDRLIFSKAHGCYGLYAILADIGFFQKEKWENFYKGSDLSGCLERRLEYGIEAGCGALGHGLPIAVGIAFGARLQEKKYKTYCVVGDGEMQEGSNWEAIQFAVKHKLTNLTVIIDSNRLQAMDYLENVLTPKGRPDDLKDKLKAFGFRVAACDGHSPEQMIPIIEKWKYRSEGFDAPQALVANTIKGYGLSCMEGVPKFHFRLPTDQEIGLGNRYE